MYVAVGWNMEMKRSRCVWSKIKFICQGFQSRLLRKKCFYVFFWAQLCLTGNYFWWNNNNMSKLNCVTKLNKCFSSFHEWDRKPVFSINCSNLSFSCEKLSAALFASPDRFVLTLLKFVGYSCKVTYCMVILHIDHRHISLKIPNVEFAFDVRFSMYMHW